MNAHLHPYSLVVTRLDQIHIPALGNTCFFHHCWSSCDICEQIIALQLVMRVVLFLASIIEMANGFFLL